MKTAPTAVTNPNEPEPLEDDKKEFVKASTATGRYKAALRARGLEIVAEYNAWAKTVPAGQHYIALKLVGRVKDNLGQTLELAWQMWHWRDGKGKWQYLPKGKEKDNYSLSFLKSKCPDIRYHAKIEETEVRLAEVRRQMKLIQKVIYTWGEVDNVYTARDTREGI